MNKIFKFNKKENEMYRRSLTDEETKDLADAICSLLIKVGQKDKEKFKPGEWIKYTPAEVRQIIIDHGMNITVNEEK